MSSSRRSKLFPSSTKPTLWPTKSSTTVLVDLNWRHSLSARQHDIVHVIAFTHDRSLRLLRVIDHIHKTRIRRSVRDIWRFLPCCQSLNDSTTKDWLSWSMMGQYLLCQISWPWQTWFHMACDKSQRVYQQPLIDMVCLWTFKQTINHQLAVRTTVCARIFENLGLWCPASTPQNNVISDKSLIESYIAKKQRYNFMPLHFPFVEFENLYKLLLYEQQRQRLEAYEVRRPLRRKLGHPNKKKKAF